MKMKHRRQCIDKARLDNCWHRTNNKKRLFYTCITTAGLLATLSCGGGGADSNAAIKDTIKGYFATFNAEDLDNCLRYFTGYEDEEDALAFLLFMRSLSGEMELKKIEGIAIIPPAIPGGSRTATANIILTIVGEEDTDQIHLKEVDGLWKIIWEQ